MNIEVVTWKIVGIQPMIQSNPAGMWQSDEPPEEEMPTVENPAAAKSKRAKRANMKLTDSECFKVAAKQLYQNEDGKFFHPAIAFQKCLLMACAHRKFGKVNAEDVVTSGVTLIEEEFVLYDPETLDDKQPRPLAFEDWLVDKRRGVNRNKSKSTGGVAIVCIRPKWKRWGGYLTLECDTDLFGKSFGGLGDLLTVGGHNFGVAVGRRRICGEERGGRPKWSDMGLGRFAAVLR